MRAVLADFIYWQIQHHCLGVDIEDRTDIVQTEQTGIQQYSIGITVQYLQPQISPQYTFHFVFNTILLTLLVVCEYCVDHQSISCVPNDLDLVIIPQGQIFMKYHYIGSPLCRCIINIGSKQYTYIWLGLYHKTQRILLKGTTLTKIKNKYNKKKKKVLKEAQISK